jgi:hypothetical protein
MRLIDDVQMATNEGGFVMSMKIVVIGGTGLIGSKVVEKLKAHGF